MSFDLSLLVYVDSPERTDDFLSDILDQKESSASIEILLLDGAGSDKPESATKKYNLPGVSIRWISLEGTGKAACYRHGVKLATGQWFVFTETSASFAKGALERALTHGHQTIAVRTPSAAIQTENDIDDQFEISIELISMRAVFSKDGKTKRYGLSRRKSSGVFDLRYHTAALPQVLGSLMIDSDLARKVSFREDIPLEFESLYILDLLQEVPYLYYDAGAQYIYTVPGIECTGSCHQALEKEWYLDSLEKVWLPLIQANLKDGVLPKYLQVAVLYQLYQKYACNYYELDHQVLNKEEAFALHRLASQILQYIDDKVIYQNQGCNFQLPRYFKMYLYQCKYNPDNHPGNDCYPYQLVIHENQLLFIDKNSQLDLEEVENRASYAALPDVISLGTAQNQEVTIRVINFENGNLEIDADFMWEYLKTSPFRFYCVAASSEEEACTQSQQVYQCPESGVYPFIKYFNVTVSHRYTFHTSVPLEEVTGKHLYFVFELDHKRYCCKLKFVRGYSRLIQSNYSYWCPDKNHYVASENANSLRIGKMNFFRHIKMESAFLLRQLSRSKCGIPARMYFVLLRLAYYFTKPFFHKRIWITFDKIYKGGDNGEYIFSYCAEKEDGIRLYYVIDPTSFDYPRLKKKYGRLILKKNSFRLRLLSLHSEAVLATHSTVPNYVGFGSWHLPFVKDLWNPKIICIQHGLTIQQIAQYQNRIFDNTTLYGLASIYEYKNICNSLYGFTDKELRITGLARFDGLHNNDQRQILITPTWRRSLVNQGIANEKKTHNDSFRESAYFRVYNSLINDQKLIDCAKKSGYRLIYLLHPAMSAQKDDFDKNDYVEIMQATGDMSYEKILTESSLMVTDYSGVQFDFAYQRKPLVYYHSAELPAQYESGGLIYETMGFGPICRNHQEIVDTLCRYMQNNCQMEDLYKKRADDFFAYDDFNNCQRIYDETRKYLG